MDNPGAFMEQHMAEDLSTLGVDWGDNDSMTQVTAENSAAILDSQLDEEAKYYEKNAYVVDGFRCPNDYIKILTPMEFEEMVNLFVKFDANRSGTIDKHETKKILHFLGLDFSLEKAEELLKIVDQDGSGEIDFEEFCTFVVLIKKGDDRLKDFGSLLEKINSTPLGELERQAQYRGLKVEFEIVEEREATLLNPTLYVAEVHLTGIWHKVDKGEIKTEYMVRKFQGMGQGTREAKYAAATAALLNLGESMPGMIYIVYYHYIGKFS
ncbi:EF-hand domain-containing protein [archaeon]|nr:MAG: EF-hand domain-containing protein [archaeon]